MFYDVAICKPGWPTRPPYTIGLMTTKLKDTTMSILISGATIIDAVSKAPIEGKSLWVEGERIKAIVSSDDSRAISPARTIDARGKYIIPGLMDANVHLLLDARMENLVRHWGRYEDLIVEAAQVALKGGLTTVFDTWGPRTPLMAVRDKINAGQLTGSRIFCAGNIIGLDGPFSPDFFAKALEFASGAMAERINAIWAENVGSNLGWLTPEQVAEEVRTYIGKGIDFVKYASSEHRMDPTAFLAFSPRVQKAMVAEAHRAGITAQSHTSSVEGLWAAIEAGCDIIQHCNISGPIAIPEATLQLLVERNTAAVVFAFTEVRCKLILEKGDKFTQNLFATQDTNLRNIMKAGATLLMAGDAGLIAPEMSSDPAMKNSWIAAGEDNLAELGQGHFAWLKAMEEKGLPAMEGLKAATRNIAVAYQKDKDLGTLEPGKIADMVILDKNPLQSAANYRSIHMVLKDGAVVDRAALPMNPLLTKPMEPPSDEVLAYRARRAAGASRYPCC